MRVNKNILKSVFFIGYHNQNDAQMTPVGSAVYLSEDDSSKGYIVTAGHVIKNLKARGVEEVFIFLNLTEKAIKNTENLPDSKGFYRTKVNDWLFNKDDQSVDVAFYQYNFNGILFDHMATKFKDCANENWLSQFEVDVGDEVIITGLFHHHFGKGKNTPIVRTGNIAAMNDERVNTMMGEMDAYLIECRSIGGISGSPVYVNLGYHRIIEGRVKVPPDNQTNRSLLIGLIHGHYDANSAGNSLEEKYEKINTGIAIVTPIPKAIETIKQYESNNSSQNII